MAHSADSFLDFAVPLVSLTLISLALCTIFNLNNIGDKSASELGLEKENLPLLSTNSLRDLTAIGSVVHKEDFEVLLVANEELLESVWKQVASLVVLLTADLWHFLSTLHSSTSEAIDTAHFSVVVRLQK